MKKRARAYILRQLTLVGSLGFFTRTPTPTRTLGCAAGCGIIYGRPDMIKPTLQRWFYVICASSNSTTTYDDARAKNVCALCH